MNSIQDMTGLTQETAEAIQVQNYGIGGHYSSHWDHRIKRDVQFDGAGNRIATALFYVSVKPALNFRHNYKFLFAAVRCRKRWSNSFSV